MGLHRTQHSLLRALGALVCAGAVAVLLAAIAPAPAAQASGVPHRVLRLGDHGQLVRRLQHLLHVPADGIFGHHTRHAVRGYQRSHHLLADGQVGLHTWRKLLRRSGVQHRRSDDGVLRLGDRGADVSHVQRLLHIRANRLYDRRTYLAVRRFQRSHHLTVDGEVGPHTLRALERASRSGHARRHHVRHATLGSRAARLAKHYKGTPYRWGGASPKGFDCSGLVQYVYGRLGVELPRVTYSQWHAGRHVSRSELRAGDLVFFDRRGHVGIYTGHGWFIHAPHRGARVHASQLGHGWFSRHFDGAVRVV
jgi:peptidoglycan hydrolase-like protein with peptidoglycan-binding domain